MFSPLKRHGAGCGYHFYEYRIILIKHLVDLERLSVSLVLAVLDITLSSLRRPLDRIASLYSRTQRGRGKMRRNSALMLSSSLRMSKQWRNGLERLT